jgi:hypothetical protein
MRRWIPLMMVGLLITAGCIIYVPSDYDQRRPDEGTYEDRYEDRYDTYGTRDYSYFYDQLSPYGSWIRYESHGYVWIPHVDRFGWRPYTNGRWAWTDQGWLWVSRYRWGWIPFHYGRWGWDTALGWYWVPGRTWAPAWVAWRTSGLYIGWAPLPPDVIWMPQRGIRSLPYMLPHSYWVFVEGPYFYNAGLYRYILPIERSTTIVNFTSLRADIYSQNNRMYNRGLGYEEAQRITKRRISRYELQNARGPGETRIIANRVSVYRPELKENQNARPRQVSTPEEAQDKVERSRLQRFDTGSESAEELVQRRQRTEVQKMEESQRNEVNQARKKMDEEMKVTRDSAQKKRVKEEKEAEIEKLKSRHSAEKTQIEKRHQTEKQSVKKKVKKK